MTTILRTRPEGLRERLILWLIGDLPVCANVRVAAGTAIEAVDDRGRAVLFPAGKSQIALDGYEAMEAALDAERPGLSGPEMTALRECQVVELRTAARRLRARTNWEARS